MLKSAIRAAIHAAGFELVRRNGTPEPLPIPSEPKPSFDGDGLKTWGKNIGFLSDPKFIAAYLKSAANNKVSIKEDGTPRHDVRWRCAVTLWAATHGLNLPGDFVECGVNTGWHSRLICDYLDFNTLDKNFWLFDTYKGLPEEQMSPLERELQYEISKKFYPECYEDVRRIFEPWPRVALVRGKVPDTLSTVQIDRVAFLHIDMNLAYPERAALEYFWPKMSPGALAVFDDYAWVGMHEQKDAADDFAASQGAQVLTLPTGQGMLIKPPSNHASLPR